MLASMSDIDPQADPPPLNWSDLGMSELLPTGTVTLLLADVEGSTRLWETQPEEMTRGDRAARSDAGRRLLSTHDGVRPVEQGEGDSFVVAFARASDAVACALALQRAPLAPIRLRIGVHTGEIQLARRGQLHRPDHQPHRAAARLGPWWADGVVGRDGVDGARPSPRRRLAHRSWHAHVTRSAAPGTGCATVPSGHSAMSSRRCG